MYTGRGKSGQVQIAIEVGKRSAGNDSDGSAGDLPDTLNQLRQSGCNPDRLRPQRNVYKCTVEIEKKSPVRDWWWRLQNIDHNLAKSGLGREAR